ncbi:MAG: OmpA family protein [Alphaproteobacteria bacterium]|nr:OmpA family protein [Alphaproteobacteria bacterium]
MVAKNLKLKNLKEKFKYDSLGYFPAVAGMAVVAALALAFILAVRLGAGCEQRAGEIVRVRVQKSHDNILEAFRAEFAEDAAKWGAVIDDSRISISFAASDMLFWIDSSDVRENLKKALADFFPRYVAFARRFPDEVDSIQVEGHTDTTGDYLYNMKLSQDRSRNVLAHCFRIAPAGDRAWLEENFMATGASYARPAANDAKSRRVEFNLKLNPSKIIEKDTKKSRRK